VLQMDVFEFALAAVRLWSSFSRFRILGVRVSGTRMNAAMKAKIAMTAEAMNAIAHPQASYKNPPITDPKMKPAP